MHLCRKKKQINSIISIFQKFQDEIQFTVKFIPPIIKPDIDIIPSLQILGFQFTKYLFWAHGNFKT